VRRKPYSVILLDEVEKAHPDVHEIFFQVFDKGMMDDSEGRRIDFKNTLILLTSNVGSEVIMDRTKNGTVRTGIEDLDTALRAPLLKV
ncbi:AAA family ATPase, partial [Klebsiella variicola]|uniref:AAA family ATPase n=2 Tax=Pseudomonadota TaxID=1224 RepID=UPI0027309BB0